MAFKDTYPFIDFGGKIDPLSEVRNAGIVTNGSVFWTKAVADQDYTTFQDQIGAANVRNTIQDSVNQTRNDRNDYVMVVPSDANAVFAPNGTVGTALLLNKSRMHLLGAGYTNNPFGYMPTIQGFGTTAAVDSYLVKVQAPAVEIGGLRILGTTGTGANGTVTGLMLLGTASTGTAHNTWIHDSTLEYNVASGGGANGTPIVINMVNNTGPDGLRVDNCVVGNPAGPTNPTVQLNHIGARHEFNRTKFVTKAAATADIGIGAGTGLTVYTLFKNCDFINVNSAAAYASFITGSLTTTNPYIVDYCTSVNVTQVGTDPTVFKAPTESGTATSLRDLGIAVGTAALAPS